LRRDGFATALAYLNGGIGWQRRNEAIHAAMRDAVGMQVLQIARNPGNGASSDMATGRARLACINISRAELEFGRT
jgi:nitrogenase subunit NifH